MKKISLIFAYILVIISVFVFSSCNNEDTANGNEPGNIGTQPPENDETQPPINSGEETVLKNFQGITFKNKTVNYNGSEQSIIIGGATLPEGATVIYTNNKATNAGTYNATATVSCTGYNTLTLNATLTINKIDLQGISFSNETFDYDTLKKTITVTGNIPAGVTITYSGGEDGKNGATSVGKYEITATLSGVNYNTLILKADLVIKSEEELLSVVVYGGKVYFQNSLDKNKLYSYNSGTLTKVNDDVAMSMVNSGSSIYYISKNLISNTISALDYSDNVSPLFDVSAEMIITDGTYLYYNVNSLVSAEKTGIWKIKISDLEDTSIDAVATKITAVKSEWLVYANGYIYFSNKNDGGKLYAISVNASNGTPIKIFDYKISDMIVDSEKIYFTKHTLTGSAIYSINVSGGLNTLVDDDSNRLVKITMSNGKYLTKINDYIYFVNVDMLTSSLFGDGIYKAKADGSSLIGDTMQILFGASKVVDGSEDNLFSLATDGDALYYYRANTKHLFKLDLTTLEEEDLMEGFTPPEYTSLITTYYEKTAFYNDEIYYINMRDGGRLYKYNILTNMEYRITGVQVADFAINGDYIYYTTIKYFVNFDLYRMSLITGEPERISTDKCMNFSFVDDKIYYTNFSGSNTFNRMNLDGTDVEILFDEESVDGNSTMVYGDDIFFVANGYFYKYNMTTGTATIVSNDMNPLEYIIYDGKILLMNCKGFTNSIGIYDIATGTVTKIDNLGTSGVSEDIRGMFVYNNEIYYYRNRAVQTNEKGLYKISLSSQEIIPERVTIAEGYRLCNSIVVGDKLYFMNVWQVKDSVPSNQTEANCGKLCVMDLNTYQITELN